ncbi:hypothetical protein CEXT_237441 [Caerostris extrusa]|uniref:Uncharacterized protein n=1 Tax=Caerostris extrusa TaxID=172846 RepID=A0AAV4VGX1_CAEEX|nr:hypothetical protein CEXT_237441 [Caerostris extrusa]
MDVLKAVKFIKDVEVYERLQPMDSLIDPVLWLGTLNCSYWPLELKLRADLTSAHCQRLGPFRAQQTPQLPSPERLHVRCFGWMFCRNHKSLKFRALIAPEQLEFVVRFLYFLSVEYRLHDPLNNNPPNPTLPQIYTSNTLHAFF